MPDDNTDIIQQILNRLDAIDNLVITGSNQLIAAINDMTSSLKAEMAVQNYNIITNALTQVNNNVNTLAGVVLNTQQQLGNNVNYIDNQLISAENNLAIQHDNIQYDIDQLGSNMEYSVNRIQSDLTSMLENAEDNITDSIGNTEDNIVSAIQDGVSVTESLINNSKSYLQTSIDNSAINTSNKISASVSSVNGSLYAAESRLSGIIINSGTETANAITEISHNVDNITPQLLVGFQMLWDNIRDFVLDKFDLSYDNLVVLYENQYKAQSKAHDNIAQELKES